MPKRGENIYKRKDNRWEGRYYAYQPDGTRKQFSVYAKSYGEVKRKLVICKEEAQKNAIHLPYCKMTAEKLFLLWLASKQNIVKASSYYHYKNIINVHLLPEFGRMTLGQLTAKKLSVFLLQKYKSLAIKTVNDILAVIKAAVKMAAREYYLPQAAQIADLKAPAVKQKRIEPFNRQEIKCISNKVLADVNQQNLAIMLALNCGLRLGEVCALKWQDIDFTAQTLAVRRNVQRLTIDGKSQLLIQTPKSASSMRIIPLTAELITLLRNWQEKSCGDYVFACTKPLEPRTLQYHFSSLLKKLAIRQRNFHTLRHTFASVYIEAGGDVKSLSEILGHAKVSITMQLYVHPSMAQKRTNMETVNFLKGLRI